MVGEVVAMRAPDFQAWLAQNGAADTLAEAGKTLFMRYGCSGCHGGNGAGGSRVRQHGAGAARWPACTAALCPLSDGTVVPADDRYIHDSIVLPQSQIVAGYAPVMPSFAGQIGEEDLLKLIAYIKSLAPETPQ